jgi:hypothetical protein
VVRASITASIAAIALSALLPRDLHAEDNAAGVTGVEAVSSKVAADYIRPKLADGTFSPEFYSFGDGGSWGGEIRDLSIDKLTFMDVARVISPALQSQKYVPARDPSKTRLLVMLYWGTTAVPPPYENDPMYQNYRQSLEQYNILLAESKDQPPGMRETILAEADDVLSTGLHQLDVENRIRDRLDFKNANMLGYDASGKLLTDQGKYLSHTALRTEGNDEVAEIEENRYFVVLMAYDFQLLWKEKKHKLLWEARFSVSQKRNEFDKVLPAMAQYAARYFGQPTNGLVRQRLLNDKVEIGEPTLIQFMGETKK